MKPSPNYLGGRQLEKLQEKGTRRKGGGQLWMEGVHFLFCHAEASTIFSPFFSLSLPFHFIPCLSFFWSRLLLRLLPFVCPSFILSPPTKASRIFEEEEEDSDLLTGGADGLVVVVVTT